MPEELSQEKKTQIEQLLNQSDKQYEEIAKHIGCNPETVKKYIEKWENEVLDTVLKERSSSNKEKRGSNLKNTTSLNYLPPIKSALQRYQKKTDFTRGKEALIIELQEAEQEAITFFNSHDISIEEWIEKTQIAPATIHREVKLKIEELEKQYEEIDEHKLMETLYRHPAIFIRRWGEIHSLIKGAFARELRIEGKPVPGELREEYTKLCAELGEVILLPPSKMIPHLAERLDLTDRIIKKAIYVAKQLEDKSYHIGRSPQGIAAACIYLFVKEYMSRKQLAKVADTSSTTIGTHTRQIKKLFRTERSQLHKPATKETKVTTKQEFLSVKELVNVLLSKSPKDMTNVIHLPRKKGVYVFSKRDQWLFVGSTKRETLKEQVGNHLLTQRNNSDFRKKIAEIIKIKESRETVSESHIDNYLKDWNMRYITIENDEVREQVKNYLIEEYDPLINKYNY